MTALSLGGLALLTLAIAQAAPGPAVNAPQPRVVLETNVGNIVIGLDPQRAPVTVENFLRYVRDHHYDGTIFHRVIPGFMVQGGGMDASMKERPTRAAIKNEGTNGLRNSRGTLAMARTQDANSATSQFFINVNDNHRLDYGIGGAGYAVFGSVVEGMDIVDRIVAAPTTSRGAHQNVPMSPIFIKRAYEPDAAR